MASDNEISDDVSFLDREVTHKIVNKITLNEYLFNLNVATTEGYELYTIEKEGKVQLINTYRVEGGVSMAERINDSALVVFVPSARANRMKLYQFKKRLLLSQYTYLSPITQIFINALNLVVQAGNTIQVHTMKNLNVVNSIKNVDLAYPDALSLGYKKSLLAIPKKDQVGEVEIIEAETSKPVSELKAHTSAIVCTRFDKQTERLATASMHGTVIRVFKIVGSQLLHTLRRGISSVMIQRFSFSRDGNFLTSCSSSSTVHIFSTPLSVCESDTSLVSEAANTGYLTPLANFGAACACLAGSEERAAIKISVDAHTDNEKVLAALFGFTRGFTALVIDSKGTIWNHSLNTKDFNATLESSTTLGEEWLKQSATHIIDSEPIDASCPEKLVDQTPIED